MISVVYCTREHKPEHIEHLKKMCGNPNVEVIEYINNGEGLTNFYQKALDEAKYNIIVFCHDDIIIETKQVANKIKKLFDKNPEYGILGVAGTKYMAKSGKWWEDKKKMYGRVKHTHNGKSWLSSYSSDLGSNIEEVITVDGVFFSVHRDRLKEGFDLDVNGFHFYDVDFCFRNYLSGVKIGVHTNVRINHMSIGVTNDEWEENRKIFSEKYEKNLPVKIDRVFNGNERFNILLTCVNISESIQLIRHLKQKKYTITVCAQPDEGGLKVLNRMGVKFHQLGEPPGYKMGDGKWQLNTQNGIITSEKNKLYRVSNVNFDLVHADNQDIINHINKYKLYPELPLVSLPLTDKLIDNTITEYQKVLM